MTFLHPLLPKAPFVYNAVVVSVHDGDTLTVSLDRGFHDYSTKVVRLVGMNARELADPGGPEARDYLGTLVPVGEPLILTSVTDDKFGGRIDGRLQAWFGDLAARLIADGYAAAWDGNGPKPVPPWPILLPRMPRS